MVCIASGPSLTRADVEAVRGRAQVIAINRSVALAPWADVLYCADAKMWKWLHDDGTLASFTGLRYGLERMTGGVKDVGVYGVTVLKSERSGLSLSPDTLSRGNPAHSGYQAINLAVHLGASRIVLLGYDGGLGPRGEKEWHAPHPRDSRVNYATWQSGMADIAAAVKALGVEVVNCSARTAYTCFERQPLDVALRSAVAA